MILALVLARAIAVTPPHASGYAQFAIPQSIDAGSSGGYPSLRIVNRSGADVPYALDPAPAVVDSRALRISDVGFIAGHYTQAVIDFGSDGALHDAFMLQTSEPTFFERVSVATSDDRVHWASVQSDAPIYRVTETSDDGNQTISTGPSHARWVRVRVLEPAHRFSITGAAAQKSPAPARLATLTRTQTVSAQHKETTVTVDLGFPDTGVDALAVESTTGHFSRHISVQTPYVATDANGLKSEAWSEVDSDSISRFVNGKPNLIIPVQMRTQRFRVVIENGDDAPLAAIVVTPLGTTHTIVFRAKPDEAYRVTWGGDAEAPQYDLSDQLAHAPWHATAHAQLAQTVAPPEASKPTPSWLTRLAIPIALGLACVVLAVVALTSLRASPR